ncbi:P44/Msp2 family outer membrane protein, partial [Candidatus Anaplasma sp. TIGMIC]
AKVPGKEIVAFAQALKASDGGINDKLCSYGNGGGGRDDHTHAQCIDTSHNSSNASKGLEDFATKSLGGGTKNWPKAAHNSHNNANDVAGDIIKLPKDDKNIVAGHFAKSIEGGEVVEIRSVSSTSVMVNACYDHDGQALNSAFGLILHRNRFRSGS